MKLANKTNLNSQHLRDIILEVARREELSATDMSKLHVAVKYRRHSGYRPDDYAGGFGYYKKWESVIKVVEGVLPDKKILAKTIACLLARNQNVRGCFDDSHYGWKDGWQQEWAWADTMPLEFVISEAEAKPAKDEKILAEMEHCVRMIQVWEKKAKLAKTKQRVWQKKFNYYERRMKAEAGKEQKK
jgi:hypothetical protein